MQAIRVHSFGDPEVMQIEDLADPRAGQGQVVVRVRAAGVNPVDTYIRAGRYPALPALPYTPGIDAAGTVEEIGPGVKQVAPGDRVYIAGSVSGTYAELALCHEWQVHALPEDISWSQGAGVNVPAATAYRALFMRAAAKPGEVVLIHGASGGVGTAAMQLACAAGMTVIGTAGTPAGMELVAQEGAHLVLDHRDPHHLLQAAEFAGGRGIDVLLEMLANVNLGRDLAAMARGGRIVVIGSRGTVEIDPRGIMMRDVSVLGMTLMNTPPEDLVRIHAALKAALANQTLRPIVGKDLPLAEAPTAHHQIIEANAFGKIVLIP